MRNLNQKIIGLSPEKRALLEARLMKKSVPETRVEIPRPSNSSAPELSFAQKSMWFLDRLQPNSSFYSIPQAMRICGVLNVEALRRSFEAIVARHEVLRTQIVAADGQPQPRIVPATLSFDLPIIKISSEEREKISQLIDAEAKRPFDLENDLMLRASLLQLDAREHILLLTVHHIASDLWSFSVLYRELAELYDAFCKNIAPQLPPLPSQYSDFARSQREFLQSPDAASQIAFWKNQLAGDLPELILPADRPRPKTQRFRGARRLFQMDSELSRRLKTFSQEQGVTLYVTLFAAFQTLLHRYSGQDDIIVGSPFGGRNRFETESLIGYFLNTLALRTDFSGDPSFVQLLQRARDVVFSAFSNREIPFEKLVDELRITRNGDQNPLFQTIFQYQPSGVPRLKLKDTEVELLELDSGTSKMDLVFTLVESPLGIAGNLEYNTDLFAAETMDRMLSHYEILLGSILENPAQNISRLNLLSEAERQKLIVDWNQTKTSFPREKTIHQLFAEQAEKTPEAVALVFDGKEMSYRELNERASRLAGHLIESGVQPGSLVAICLDRSFELLVSILAVLKAGAGYVPLDINFPEERLRLILEDTAASVLVTDKEFSFCNARKINPRKLFPLVEEPAFAAAVPPESVAYVMYTSGSTGKPKGVAVPHRAVVRLVKETNFMQFSAEETFLQFATVSFDASTLEIWGSLLNGAKLVIHPPEMPSLAELGQTLREQKITTLWLTAGLFHQMVEDQIESLRGIKQLLAGGDVLSVPHVEKVLEELPDCQLINGYGPTENTTFTCCYSVPKNWSGESSVPIGKPISNTQVYILDKNLGPVPIGVPGELFIGGDGLARGYLNAPELNAEKFIANPFAPGERLYKTGDNARWLAEGNIEFLGRRDHQIKLRGFRIELGEIEAAISDHPLVRQTLVVAREISPSEKQLVAYLTKEADVPLNDEELRTYLEQRLPHYMIPSQFVALAEFPLTQNGKVDRRRLPAPENSITFESIVAPRNSTEQTLWNIWYEILGRNSFGVHENFFQLGGHSLLATRVVSRIAQEFQIQFSLRQIFEFPTVAGLAKAVAEASSLNMPQLTRRSARAARVSPPGQAAKISADHYNLVADSNTQTHANVLRI